MLVSIIDFSRWGTACDHSVFECSPVHYWSSSPRAYDPDFAWHVDTMHADVNALPKGLSWFVRCVRGRP
jgi:hypothetical protein